MVNYEAIRRGKRRQLVRTDPDGVLVIHSGLSVTVAGHLLTVERDEATKVVRVVAQKLAGHVDGPQDGPALSVAARLLVKRAVRFLGSGWTVLPLEQPRSQSQN